MTALQPKGLHIVSSTERGIVLRYPEVLVLYVLSNSPHKNYDLHRKSFKSSWALRGIMFGKVLCESSGKFAYSQLG